MNETERKRVRCPYCDYRMPLDYDLTTSCHGVYLRCKGSHCKKEFELVIKDGNQYKRPWLYEKISGMFKYLF